MYNTTLKLKPETLVALLQGKAVNIQQEDGQITITLLGGDVVLSNSDYEQLRRQLYKEGYNDGLVDKLKELERQGDISSSESKGG